MNNLALRNQPADGVSILEAVELGATDPGFFGEFFFPKTCRQAAPAFHREMDALLDDNSTQFNAFKVFRGGAKTSKVRLFIARRVAYAVSRTILVVGKSQDHAKRTVQWLMKAVEFNSMYAQTFQLRPGKKWTAEEIEIFHGTDEVPISIVAIGITGSTRGLNIDDYRPDLIVVDDPCDEENTATPEQREKISDLFFGALAKSLAPTSEAPSAKMILLQTPLNAEDLVSKCTEDPQWRTVTFGCFDEAGRSAWEVRWSTETLLRDKQAHIARNQLSLWLREMECRIVSRETSAFIDTWLQYWEVLPPSGVTFLAIDPTPPPKDMAKRASTKLDDAVIMVLRVGGGKTYVCEYYITKSPDEQEFLNKIFELAVRWRVRKIAVETHLFQRVIANLIEKEMLRRRQWFTLIKIEDKREKSLRIKQEITSRASNRVLFVNRSMVEFIEQYTAYPNVKHDDLLDALAIGMCSLNVWEEDSAIEGESERVEDDDELTALPDNWRGAP